MTAPITVVIRQRDALAITIDAVNPVFRTIAPSFLAAASTVFAVSLLGGAHVIEAPLIDAGTTVYGPQQINQSVAAPIIAASGSVFQPSVVPQAMTVTAPQIAASGSVYQPALEQTAPSLRPPLLDATGSVYQPAVSTGAVSVTAPFVAATGSVYQPAVSAGTATVTAPIIAASGSVYQPAVDMPFPTAALSSLVGWWAADEATNTVSTGSTTFVPSDVNTTTNRITMTLAGFVRLSGADAWNTPVRFSTTGTLPAPLVADTDYLIEDMGDGTFRVFPIMTDADYTLFSGFEEGESVKPYYGYSLEVGEIDFTTQGTGTHTVYTGDLFETLNNKTSNDVDLIIDGTTRNVMLRKRTDGNSKPYIELPGVIGHKNDNGSSGKRLIDSMDNATFGALINAKRYYYQVHVLKPYVQNHVAKYRCFMRPTVVTAATGVFAVDGHGFTTGTAVTWGAISNPGGAFPTATVSMNSTVYVRRIDANSFSLHPTSSDATSNTNKYVYSNTGTKVFYISDDKSSRLEPMYRSFLLDVNTDSGNNHHATTSIYTYAKDTIVDSTTFRTTTAFNGLIVGACSATTYGTLNFAFQVYLFVPSGAVMPIRSDTGTRLAKGWYWATQEGNNLRLHQSQALATAAVGVGVSSLTTSQVIKSSDTTGITGKILTVAPDLAYWRGFQDTMSLSGVNARITVGGVCVLTCIHDFPGSSLLKYTTGQNGVGTGLVNVDSGMTTASNVGNSLSKMNYGNTNEPHVPFKGDVYESLFGVTDSDPTTIMNQIVGWAKTKYGIA